MDVSKYAQGNSQWLNHTDLPQPYQVVTIVRVAPDMVGQPPEEKLCFWFAELPKAYASNATGVKRAISAFGPDGNGWAGKQLVIYRSMTSFQGRQTLCIRFCAVHEFPYKDPEADFPDPVYDAAGQAIPVQPIPQATVAAAPQAMQQPVAQPVAQPVVQQQPVQQAPVAQQQPMMPPQQTPVAAQQPPQQPPGPQQPPWANQ